MDRLKYIPDTTTSRTLSLSDVNGYINFSNASAITCTVPPQSSVAWITGTQVTIRRDGSGILTLAQGVGVTLKAPSGGTLTMSNGMTVTLIRTDTSDVWHVVGQTVPT